MLHRTAQRLRIPRKRTPYVRKYLEGCPLPETLVDDIAGANLRSTAPLFTTIPRYIVAAESRLSKLFFHHALYPAGGARRPCRVVVVRGGRSVRGEQPFATAPHGGEDDGETGKPCTRWDPARRPYFYARPSAVGCSSGVRSGSGDSKDAHVGNGGVGRHGTIGVDRGTAIKRPSVDSLLSPLCGVIEAHFAAGGTRDKARMPDDDDTRNIPDGGGGRRVALVELLSGGHGGLVLEDDAERAEAQAPERVALLLREAAPHASSFFYVHTQLPASAVFVSRPEAVFAPHRLRNELQPVHPARQVRGVGEMNAGTAVVSCLAGGLEPTVHFAVGSPLPVWRHGFDGNAPFRGSGFAGEGRRQVTRPSALPFGHVQCLLRVCTKGRGRCTRGSAEHGNSSQSDSAVLSKLSASHAARTESKGSKTTASLTRDACGIVEPWRLGAALDPKVPFITRTLTERRPTSVGAQGARSTPSDSRSVVGDSGFGLGGLNEEPSTVGCASQLLVRNDCETYLLPQRELLLSFHVPEDVEAMCREQNEERARRQAALGYVTQSHAFAEGPRTSTRVLQGMQANLEAAEAALSASHHSASDGTSPLSSANSGRIGRTSGRVYEVRALPGDVVFVPRGWKYSVERIVGTAIIDAVAAPATSRHEALQVVFRTTPSQLAQGTAGEVRGCSAEAEGESHMESDMAEIVGVEVDAFVLCYKPYPVLSAAQAATYVAANYVHGGIDEFYEKGGNNVYHKYT